MAENRDKWTDDRWEINGFMDGQTDGWMDR